MNPRVPFGDVGADEVRAAGVGEPDVEHRSEQNVAADHRDHLVIGAMFLGAAGCVLVGSSEPTALRLSDVVVLALFGAIVALASAGADWRALLLSSAAATAFADGTVAITCGAAGLVLAIAVGRADQPHRDRRRTWQVGAAASGALTAAALTHLSDGARTGTSTVVVLLVTLPVLWSGYRGSSRGTRRVVHRTVLVVATVVAVVAMLLAAAALLARDSATRGKDLATEGLALARAGDSAGAEAKFRAAARSFAEANDEFHRPWVAPSLVVPGLSQNADAMRRLTSAGQELSGSTADALASADYRGIRIEDGQVDLAALAAMIEPVGDANEALARASDTLDGTKATWLLPPVRGPFDDLRAAVGDARADGSLAGQVLAVSSALLGGNGERRYFIAFTNPAEARSLGGFIGSYAILHAKDGKVTIERDGSITELAEGAEDRTFRSPALAEFAGAESRWTPSLFFQNLTATPDPVTSALAIADQYEQTSGGTRIDGVFTIDPFGLAALLALTGPLDVEGIDRPLTKDNAADFLLKDQYIELGDVTYVERKDVLQEAGRATFDALTSRRLSGPSTIGQLLGPAVDRGHIRFVSFTSEEAAVSTRVGLTRPFGAQADRVVISLRTSNSSGNKADAYLQRELDFDVTVDADNGSMEAIATITLTNSIPDGLPEYVASGAFDDAPLGTNAQYVQFYSPLVAERATLDGADVAIEPGFELGLHSATSRMEIARGQTRTFVLHLRGPLPPDWTSGALPSRYLIDVAHQPVVRAGRVTVTVRDRSGRELDRASFDAVSDRLITVDVPG